jgi:hypothetical protein
MTRRLELFAPWVVVFVVVLVGVILAPSLPTGRKAEAKERIGSEEHPLIESTLDRLEAERDRSRPLVLLFGNSILHHAWYGIEAVADERCEALALAPCPQIDRIVLSAARLQDFARYVPRIVALEPDVLIVQGSVVLSRPKETDRGHRNPEAMRRGPRPGTERTAEDYERIRKQWAPVTFDPELRDLGTLRRLHDSLPDTRIMMLQIPRSPTMLELMPKGYRRQFLETLAAFSESREIPILSVGDDSDWEDDLYYDFVHFNRRGHRRIAQSGVVDELLRTVE